MSRRTLAGLVAAGLFLVLGIVAALVPVNYVVFSPGPTINVLGKSSGDRIISVDGHKAYRDDGGLRLLTVIDSGPDRRIDLIEAMTAWLSPDKALYPYDAIYAPQDTRQSVRKESAQEMVSSQDNAVAAALHALGIRFGTAVRIASVDKGGPAAGKLKNGDVIQTVDGKPVHSLKTVVQSIKHLKPGTPVTVKVRRGADDKSFTMKTVAAGPKGADTKHSMLKVAIAPTYDFPFHVAVHLDDNIGGPSAGLMFSMGIYDILTPGSLTDGKVIAGTGEINAQGKVGPIGGIQQKLVGAQNDGAHLFLAPAGNCAEALDGHFDPDKMRLVKVTTLAGALKDVKAWTKDPNVKLPRCTK